MQVQVRICYKMAFKTKTIYAFLEISLTVCIFAVYCFFHVGADVYNKAREKIFGLERSVKRASILWKQRISFLNNSTPRDFFCLNFTRVEPEYVLRPNVSLYTVTDKEAIFVETPAKMNIYSSDTFPFFFAAQFIHGTHVIRMDIECFHSLADQVGDPSVPVTWMSNTGRCGSTMMCQIFESVEGTLVMAEPDAVQNVFYLLQDRNYIGISTKDCQRILKSTVRMLCKPRAGTERIFIKLRSSCTALMADMSTLFPDIKHLFLYRNCEETVASFANALNSLPYGLVLRLCSDNEVLSNFVPLFRKLLRYHIGTKRKDAAEVPLNENTIGILTYLWAEQILLARDAISRDKRVLTTRYEEIVSKPMETIKEVFENTGVDLKHLGKAVSSLSKDSQRGTGLSRSSIGNQSRKVGDADRVHADRILTGYNLPLLGSDFRL